jgi:hypothetical protein
VCSSQKIETQPYDGTLKNVSSFRKTFEATLVSDDSEWLSYLLYYCRDPAELSKYIPELQYPSLSVVIPWFNYSNQICDKFCPHKSVSVL